MIQNKKVRFALENVNEEEPENYPSIDTEYITVRPDQRKKRNVTIISKGLIDYENVFKTGNS